VPSACPLFSWSVIKSFHFCKISKSADEISLKTSALPVIRENIWTIKETDFFASPMFENYFQNSVKESKANLEG
jgi:hypothetical protein